MTSPTPAPGAIIGSKYRIERLLGEGGMGAVFEAENTVTLKRVALKWMHPQLASDPDAVQRFTREAQASSRIRHPNVVDVYDILHEGDAIFMVMELLEGESLGSIIERRGAAVPALIGWEIAAMRGVAKAHKEGVVHRDIKPDNIFLTRQEDGTFVPKVLDFGISKIRGTDNLSLTRTGAALGTPLYMSLEQLTGQKDIDERTDVYAFGVILYETVTGQMPFQAETLTELAVKIATTEPPPPKAVQPTVPTALEHLILWAMTKKREDRLPSMERFIQELEPFGNEASYREHMTRHAASLPNAATLVAAMSPPAQAAAAQLTGPRSAGPSVAAVPAVVPGRETFESVADPITLPVRRLPVGYAALGLLALLAGGAVAWQFGGSDGAPPALPAPAKAAEAAPPPPAEPAAAAEAPAVAPGDPAAAPTAAPAVAATAPNRAAEAAAPAQAARDTPGRAERPETPKSGIPAAHAPEPPAPAAPIPAAGATPTVVRAQAAPPPGPRAAPLLPAQPLPPVRPATAPAVARTTPTPSGGWTPVPMPRRSLVGGIFGSDAQSARRKAMLQHGPPYRSVTAAKRAYSQKLIDEQTYEDNIWALKTWRANAISAAKQDYENRVIDKAQYKQRIARIDAQYKGG